MIFRKRLEAYFYQNSGGAEPVRDWIIELPRHDRKIVGSDILKIQYCWPIGMPLCKPIGKGLYEVRSNIKDSKIARVFFCVKENKIVLLHGFIKKSQKTPKRELEIAINRMKDIQ